MIMDYGDKWRLAYWDNTARPRKKRGKVWSKSIVPTRRKAQQLADDFMAGVNERNNAPHLRRDTAETFAALVEMYREKIAPHLKNSTRMNYNFFLDTYLIPAWGEKRLVKLRLVDLQDFFNVLKLAPKTIRNMHACLRTVLNEGKKWAMLKENPAVGVRLPRVPRKQTTLLKPEDIKRLIESLPWPTNALVTLMVNGSLRIGEVAALRWKRVLKDRIEIRERIYEGEFDETKSDAGDRDVPLDSVMKAALKHAWNVSRFRKPDDLVFTATNGSPINRRNLLNRHLKVTLKKLGLPACTFHDLRHLHSSLSMRTGASPEVTRDNMGHSTVDVTQNIYTGTWWEQRAEAVRAIGELIWGGAGFAQGNGSGGKDVTPIPPK
jgi:integrase